MADPVLDVAVEIRNAKKDLPIHGTTQMHVDPTNEIVASRKIGISSIPGANDVLTLSEASMIR